MIGKQVVVTLESSVISWLAAGWNAGLINSL
jgi:hypothetical protein